MTTTAATDHPTTPPGDLETQIRQAIHTAHQHGKPAPGRPTLVRLTGATDHAVRRVLAHLATRTPPAPPTRTSPQHQHG